MNSVETISLQLNHNLIFVMLNHAMLVICIGMIGVGSAFQENPILILIDLVKVDFYYADCVQKSDS